MYFMCTQQKHPVTKALKFCLTFFSKVFAAGSLLDKKNHALMSFCAALHHYAKVCISAIRSI